VDSHARSIAKALSWRFLATIITFSVAWLITGALAGAVAIGLADTMVKLGIYYAHERAWDRVPFGRREPKDYQI
jgi:uncharacterized membrane protein